MKKKSGRGLGMGPGSGSGEGPIGGEQGDSNGEIKLL